MYRVTQPNQIATFDIAIDSLAEKNISEIPIVTIIPPPPIPPALHNPIITPSEIAPKNSGASIGKTLLCKHFPLKSGSPLLSFQVVYGGFQSLLSLHFFESGVNAWTLANKMISAIINNRSFDSFPILFFKIK